jgi:hypothetical protein
MQKINNNKHHINCQRRLYSKKLENFEEMDRFLEYYDHLKLNQEDNNHLY